jgi:hypothetical protein
VTAEFDKDIERVFVDQGECETIKDNLGHRVAKVVLESLYTVADLSFDFPSSEVVKSLIPAAGDLKKVALEKHKPATVEPLDHLHMRLLEAETLLRACRQRVAGLPPTREFSRLPFELPPPVVRVYYEAFEHVVNSILQMFRHERHFHQYVVIDNVDGPKHSLLAIRMPEHRLKEIPIYPAITHEAFHAHVERWLAPENEALHAAIKDINTATFHYDVFQKYQLLAEIAVELFDFEFSYLGDYCKYVEEEWTFFARHFRESVKREFKPSDIVIYLLRTFSLKLWDEGKTELIKADDPEAPSASFYCNYPQALRKLLREHIDAARLICVDICGTRIAPAFSPSLLYKMQHDIGAIAPVIDRVFFLFWKEIQKMAELLSQLRQQRQEIQGIVNSILQGRVCNEPIGYPHLVVHGVANLFRAGGRQDVDESRVADALVMTLWNASNKPTGDNRDLA